jgi:hypothetical protein
MSARIHSLESLYCTRYVQGVLVNVKSHVFAYEGRVQAGPCF